MLIHIFLVVLSALSFSIQARVKNHPEWKKPLVPTLPEFMGKKGKKELTAHEHDTPAQLQKKNSITTVPFGIDTSGYYTIDADLVNLQAEAAITITANDVILDSNNHIISLQADGASGIEIVGSRITLLNPVVITPDTYKTSGISMLEGREVTINNPSIYRYSKPDYKSAAISAVHSESLQVNSPTIDGYWYGLLFKESRNITIKGGSVSHASACGVGTVDVSDISISQLIVEKGKEEQAPVALGFWNTDTVTIDSCTISKAIWGISTNNTKALTVKNSTIDVAYVGIMPGFTDDVIVTDCCIKNCHGIVTLLGKNACISNVIFANSGFALDLASVHNALIQKCIFSNFFFNGLWLDTIPSAIVEDCSFEASDDNSWSFAEIDYVDSCIVRNCTFTSHSTLFDTGIQIVNSQSVLLDKLALTIEPREILPGNGPVAVYLYSEKDAQQPHRAVKISDCIIGSQAYINILSESQTRGSALSHIAIERCLLNGGINGIVLSNAQSSTIDGCSIKNCLGNGITITNSIEDGDHGVSALNTVSNCTIVNNGGDGIHLDPNVGKTLINGNTLFNNGGTGIASTTLTLALNNIFYANGVNETITPSSTP